ncbi:regulatory factor X-associated protein, isoform CRA_b [Mus musculus]|nr:regulatory factor X-associated protein, isoform CRA_b [Mus musculus]
MRQDEAEADGALRPGLAGSEAAADAEDEAGDDDADLLDTSDPAGGGESAASPEELEDEDAEAQATSNWRKAQTTYSPLSNREQDPLVIALQDLLF